MKDKIDIQTVSLLFIYNFCTTQQNFYIRAPLQLFNLSFTLSNSYVFKLASTIQDCINKVTLIRSNKVTLIRSNKVTLIRSNKVTLIRSNKVTLIRSNKVTLIRSNKVTLIRSNE